MAAEALMEARFKTAGYHWHRVGITWKPEWATHRTGNDWYGGIITRRGWRLGPLGFYWMRGPKR